MRIIYILSSTTPFGGASKSFLNLMACFVKMDVTPLVITPDNNGLCTQLDELGIPHRSLFYRYGTYPQIETKKDRLLFIPRLCGRVFANIIGTIQLYKIAKKFGPDIIHTNVSIITIGYRVARILHIPHIWHIREFVDKGLNMRFYPTQNCHLRALLKPLSYSICITNDIAKYLHLDGCPQSRVIYNGIITSGMQEEALSNDKRENVFFYAGHIEPIKGVMEMIVAFGRSIGFMKERHQLVLAGKLTNPNYYEQVKSKIAEMHIENDVRFLGEISNVQDWMRKSKAVVIPTICEGFGRVMPEAMSVGALVIAHNTAGSKEQLDNGKELTGNEIGLRYNNANELTDCFISVANNDMTQYDPMRIYAKKTINHYYTIEQYSMNVYAFYKDILNI